MNTVFYVKSEAEVKFKDLANEFAGEGSEEQAVFLKELFNSLKSQCEDHFRFEKQLWHIAKYIKDQKIDNLMYVVETLNAFIKDEL